MINRPSSSWNGCLFPGGPLRESIETCLQRSQALVIIQDFQEEIPPFLTDSILKTKDILVLESSFSCHLNPQTPVIGFSGIGYPHRFEKALHTLFHQVQDILVFPDHALYNENQLARLKEAMNRGRLVTTEKDWIKLPQWLQSDVSIVHQKLHPKNPAQLTSLVTKWLSNQEIFKKGVHS